ncbi:MAG: ASCH domain-containing protein [Nocardioidaceae bacterium]|nr:ASCH domain-containing protein [Nocardioidaceae bacterium]
MQSEAVRAFWASYVDATGEAGEPAAVYAFGDNAELAEELVRLVLSGRKTATAELVAQFAADGEPLPQVADRCVVTDAAGVPRAVLRTTEVRVGPLASVEPAFAWDEGEGDRTVESWRGDHERYFRRSCAKLGIDFSGELEVVFERFEKVWPA